MQTIFKRKKKSNKLIIGSEKIQSNNELMKTFTENLDFELTSAQKRTINEILKDMNKNSPMKRLLQGDVGSGKTIVAACAVYSASNAGFKSALMAPTEVLAEQHFNSKLRFSVKVFINSLFDWIFSLPIMSLFDFFFLLKIVCK